MSQTHQTERIEIMRGALILGRSMRTLDDCRLARVRISGADGRTSVVTKSGRDTSLLQTMKNKLSLVDSI